MTTSSTREALWARAAACYLRAGPAWSDDASRCLAEAGDHTAAARIAERRGHHARAAELFVVAAAWTDAARCWLACDRAADAAACYERAGDLLEAGWTLAHRAAQPLAGRAMAERWSGDRLERPACEVLIARCEAGVGQRAVAAQKLTRAMHELRRLPVSPVRTRALDWAFAVAEQLRRPDLSALLHAAAASSAEPGAIRRWEAWALDVLHDASGIPAAPPSPSVPSGDPEVRAGRER